MTLLDELPMIGQEQEGTRAEGSLQTRWSLIGRLKDLDDQQSWQEFFDGYWRLIYSVALKAGLNDADAQDVVQATVISVAKKISEFKADPAAGSFKSWLFTLTRWRIKDQIRKRKAGQASSHFHGVAGTVQGGAGGTPALPYDDKERTATVERVADPSGQELEAIWNEEWEKHLLAAAAERVKGQVDPEQFQLFDFHVLKQWPANKVARKLGVSLGKVYFAKYKISRLLKKEIKKLKEKI